MFFLMSFMSRKNLHPKAVESVESNVKYELSLQSMNYRTYKRAQKHKLNVWFYLNGIIYRAFKSPVVTSNYHNSNTVWSSLPSCGAVEKIGSER